MPIPTRKTRLPAIDELAFEHCLKGFNDRYGGVVARMRRNYGRAATEQALKEARQTLRLIDNN